MNTTRTGLFFSLTVCLTAALMQTAHAQCAGGIENPNIVSATPSDDFRPLTDGLVLHRPTQLVWQRCALGQSWTGSSCSGSALLLDWAAALQAADDHEQAEQTDWRLPNRNELASIIETRCHSPAINGEAFPGTPLDWFWTGSPFVTQPDQAWVVLFSDGDVQSATTDGQYAVRLVRGGRL